VGLDHELGAGILAGRLADSAASSQLGGRRWRASRILNDDTTLHVRLHILVSSPSHSHHVQSIFGGLTKSRNSRHRRPMANPATRRIKPLRAESVRDGYSCGQPFQGAADLYPFLFPKATTSGPE
jgi:hypothetical protein